MPRSDFTAMDSFLNDIGRYPLMTADEEIRLGRYIRQAQQLLERQQPLTPAEQRIIKRGNKARRRFFEGNLRLCVYIAKKYAGRCTCMDITDLIQEGGIGLMRAIEKYDPERGYKFSTYAYWWVRQSITRSISYYERSIRRPAAALDLASKLPKAVHELSVRLGRVPTTAELAEAMKVKESELYLLMERGGHTISLDALIASCDELSLIEVLADPNTTDKEAHDLALDLDLRVPQMLELLQRVPEKERECIERRFGLNGYHPHTFQQIANGLDVSRERARQLIDKGLNKIRLHLARQQASSVLQIQNSQAVVRPAALDSPRRLKPLSAPIQQFA